MCSPHMAWVNSATHADGLTTTTGLESWPHHNNYIDLDVEYNGIHRMNMRGDERES